MLYKKIQVGEKEINFCASASINVCYLNVFHQDFIKMISTDEGMAASAVMQMAFIMAKFAELNDRKKVNRLTEDDYCDWLDQFTTGDLVEALPEVQTFYMASTGQMVDTKKNSEEPSAQ